MIKLIPNHVAIIMDGNGRWARAHNIPKLLGHKKGAETAKTIIKACIDLGIPCLTLYAFSSENWNRPEQEVNDLMELLRIYLQDEVEALHKNNVKLRIIGDVGKLPLDVQTEVLKCQDLTKDNNAINVNIALSYGSRQEIIIAVRRIAKDILAGKLNLEEIDIDKFSDYLYTYSMPDPDLLIRTSGEQRLSNFLLWQSAYTELFFTDILWPDFTKEDLNHAITEFQTRERRYGS
ncbi:Undecaprenyl pyrophosphate synthase [Rickettsiales bacterium Ac37b]|nr:Undecaprenyl pyrophosphate synthase [Rickettsiales bacterium Ac37b]